MVGQGGAERVVDHPRQVVPGAPFLLAHHAGEVGVGPCRRPEVQVALTATAPGRTRLNAHLEKLPDAESREVMRERMRVAMERVAEAATAEH